MTGLKTFLFGLAVTIFGALEGFDFTAYLGSEKAGYVTGVIGVIIMILRYLTTTPIFKSE